MYDLVDRALATGLYLAPSLLVLSQSQISIQDLRFILSFEIFYQDHSCTPTATWSFTGRRLEVNFPHIFSFKDSPEQLVLTCLQVHTLCPLDDLSLSKLRICYLDPFKPLEERRSFLRQNYFFHCDCLRCEREEKDMGRKDGEEEAKVRARGEAFMSGQLEPEEVEWAVREVVRVLGEKDMLSLRATKLLFNLNLDNSLIKDAVAWGLLCWSCYRHHIALNPSAYVQTLVKLAHALSLIGSDYVEVVTEVHRVCKLYFQSDKYITYYTNIIKNMEERKK